MEILKHGLSAIGKLFMAGALAAAFFAGLFGVVYMQLTGGEVEIPKIVGMNFNDGLDELNSKGLRIRKIASRYSNEDPNTILEQRPRAGTVAKTGLIISVVVSEKNPEGDEEAPAEVKDDDEAIEEIQDLPELKTDKSRRQSKASDKKEEPKTRDVIEEKPESTGGAAADDSGVETKSDGTGSNDRQGGDKKDGSGGNQKTEKPKPEVSRPSETAKPPAGEVRPRKSPPGNF